MLNDLIRFHEIKKCYSSIEALKHISFTIPENSIFGILGANGSGKSTLMKILPGLIKDWSGDIYYKNQIVSKNNMVLKKEFGYLIEAPTFYEYLSAVKNLEILARISNTNFNRIFYVLELVGLLDRSNDKVSSYSYGMKQRLGIAQVLLHNPDVVVLDEPNNGLDPNGIADMTKLVKKMHYDGKTVILSTHNLKDVENMCTHFTVFNKGVNSTTNSMNNLFTKSNKWNIVTENTDLALKIINEASDIRLVDNMNNRIIIESNFQISLESINKLLEKTNPHSISKESNLIEYFSND